jgi:hypothetical protein
MTDTTTKTIQLAIAANPNASHTAIADKVISRLKLPLSHRSRIAQRVGRMRNKGKQAKSYFTQAVSGKDTTMRYEDAEAAGLANVLSGKDIVASHKLHLIAGNDSGIPRTSLDDWHEEEVQPSFFATLWRAFTNLFRRGGNV